MSLETARKFVMRVTTAGAWVTSRVIARRAPGAALALVRLASVDRVVRPPQRQRMLQPLRRVSMLAISATTPHGKLSRITWPQSAR